MDERFNILKKYNLLRYNSIDFGFKRTNYRKHSRLYRQQPHSKRIKEGFFVGNRIFISLAKETFYDGMYRGVFFVKELYYLKIKALPLFKSVSNTDFLSLWNTLTNFTNNG